MYLLMLP